MSFPRQPAPPGTGANATPVTGRAAPPRPAQGGAGASQGNGAPAAPSSAAPAPTSAYGYGYNYHSYYGGGGGYGPQQPPPRPPPQQPGSYPYQAPPQSGPYPGGHYGQQQHSSPYAAYNAAYAQQQQHYSQQQQHQQHLAKQLQAFAKYDGRKRNYNDDSGPGFGGGGYDHKRPRFDDYGGRGGFGGGFRGRGRGGFGERGGGFGGRGGRRSNFNNSMEGCEPMHVNFDNILTDKRFNFWNLPSKARVLLISNLSMNIAQPLALFNLFSFYGDVRRVKILRAKLNVALVEFRTATMAAIARDHTDGCVVSGKKIVVSFSKFDQIYMPQDCNEADDGYTQDFSGPTFTRLHRFAKPELAKANLKRITKPTSCLHIANIPGTMTANEVKQHFETQGGLQVNEVLAIEQRSKKSKENEPTAPGETVAPKTGADSYNRLMAYFEMSSISDAAAAMAMLSGTCATNASDPASGLKISFVATTLEEQKSRIKKDTKSNLAVVDADAKAGSSSAAGDGGDGGDGASV